MAALTAAEQPLCASLWRRLIVMAAASAAGTQLQRQRWQAALHVCGADIFHFQRRSKFPCEHGSADRRPLNSY